MVFYALDFNRFFKLINELKSCTLEYNFSVFFLNDLINLSSLACMTVFLFKLLEKVFGDFYSIVEILYPNFIFFLSLLILISTGGMGCICGQG